MTVRQRARKERPSLVVAAERRLRRLGGLAALAVLVSALTGLARGFRRPVGRQLGRPGPSATPSRLLAVSTGFFAASALLWRDLPIRLGVRARALASGAGGAALFAGLGVCLAGRIALGSAYNVSSALGARLFEGQRLVVTGPYRVVRHPMYAGAIVAAVGALLLYRTWTTLSYVAALPVLVLRAQREDEVLAAQFGDEWRAYRDRVPAWIPRTPM